MKIAKETVFRCDFCNKAMLNKGAMSLHERQCKMNPKNRHQCFKYCKYLKRTVDTLNGGISFYCDKLDKELYSFKLERFKSQKNRMIGKERMPLKCQYYEIEDGHDEDWVREQK